MRWNAGALLGTTITTAIVATLVSAAPAAAQGTMAPTNDLPNPYQTVEGFFKAPPGRTWGSTSAVAIDRDGQSIWVAERCGANTCAGSRGCRARDIMVARAFTP